jgi:hypothetical protein
MARVMARAVIARLVLLQRRLDPELARQRAAGKDTRSLRVRPSFSPRLTTSRNLRLAASTVDDGEPIPLRQIELRLCTSFQH